MDKVGRTARRSVDTHLKHAVTKPRVATALSRMNAVFNFIPEQRELHELYILLRSHVPFSCNINRGFDPYPKNA